MNIQNKLQQKKDELKRMVEEFNPLLEDLNKKNLKILEINAVIKAFQKLINEQNKDKKND